MEFSKLLNQRKIFSSKILLLFFTVLINAFMWLLLVPMWHTPDEQAHFAQVVFIVENDRPADNSDNLDLSEEIFISEVLLGTQRDRFGNNKFTHHPEYKIDYSQSQYGIYESSISALARSSAKRNFITKEAARYPRFYYDIASFIYRLLYESTLFDRVYAIRFLSLIFFGLTIVSIYLIGTVLFGKNDYRALILSGLVGFQPMFIFSNIGVTSDVLGNLFFHIFLFQSVYILTKGLSLKRIIILVSLMCCNIITKPQSILSVPLGLLVLFFVSFRDAPRSQKSRYLLLISGGIIAVCFIFLDKIILLLKSFISNLNYESLLKYSIEYTLPHTYKEVLPWYWGVFKWLGVTYPRIVHRIINRIIVVAFFGFFMWLVLSTKKKLWSSRQFQSVIFLLISTGMLYISVSVFDWQRWYITKYPLGVQGRYFFLTIASHVFILLIGMQTIVRKNWLRIVMGKVLLLLMMLLNIVGLVVIIVSYYHINSFIMFVNQISQYKPEIVKGWVFILLILVWFFSQVVTVVTILRLRPGHQNLTLDV